MTISTDARLWDSTATRSLPASAEIRASEKHQIANGWSFTVKA
jgi:hypothetical protein